MVSDGLRLRLWPVPPELTWLPWELLYNREKRVFPALDPRTPVIRHWPSPQPLQLSPGTAPLRGLLALASPKDMMPLNIDDERTRVMTVLTPLQRDGRLQINVLQPATRIGLLNALRRGVRFLHFVGHGWSDKKQDEGGLVVEDDKGRSVRFTAEHLSDLLRGTSVALVVLGACEVACTAPAVQALLHAEAPAVVAMQTKITDEAAIRFSQQLYTALADDSSLEAAVTHARTAVKVTSSVPGEWASPVVFLANRVGDLHLLSRAKKTRAIPRAHRLPAEPYYPMRQRETEMGRVLSQLRSGKPMILIAGLGGIGKTALTIEAARRCLGDRKSEWAGFVWASAKQEMLVDGDVVKLADATLSYEDLLNVIGEQLGRPEMLRLLLREKEDAAAELLRQRPYLIVVDNLESAESAQELVDQLQIILGRSQALISSRKRVHGAIFTEQLQGLDEKDSLYFMRREAAERNVPEVLVAQESDLLDIYKVTGGNPLAMKLVVSQVRELDLDIVLQRLRDSTGDLYSFIYRAAWDELSEIARKVLVYIAAWPASIARAELEEVGIAEGTALDRSLSQLVRLSLLVPRGGLRKRYGVHQLTRNFASQFGQEEGLL